MAPLPYNLSVPDPAVKVVKTRVDEATNVPLLPNIVPVPETAPVVVATPEPIANVPVLDKVEENNLLPELDPMLPALVTGPVKVSVPDVEVTVVPVTMEEAPTIVSAKAADESVPEPSVVKAPLTVAALVMIVAVPPFFLRSRL